MNKNNFKKLIKAIETDGVWKFNMSCFLGKLDVDDEAITYYHENGMPVGGFETHSISTVKTTEMFNCDSVGCIAGFATGLANEWKTPNFLKGKDSPNFTGYGNYSDEFEGIANKYLGLTEREGQNLYYANEGHSIWKFVKWSEPDRYSDLEWSMDYDDNDVRSYQKRSVKWWDNDMEVELNSIDYEIAMDVLTRIMNEEIGLAKTQESYPDYIIKPYKPKVKTTNIQVIDMVKAMVAAEPCLFNNSSDNLMVNSKERE